MDEENQRQRRVGVPNNCLHLHQVVRFAIDKETNKRGGVVVSVDTYIEREVRKGAEVLKT